MGERYWVTGVQIGLFRSANRNDRNKEIDLVIDNQFIGNYYTEEEKKEFLKKMKEAFEDVK